MGACVAGAGAASADSNFKFTRVDGGSNNTRYGTSVAIAKRFGNADTAILASGEPGHYPDALSANYLSGQLQAPVLLTQHDSTPSDVLAQLKAAGVKNVVLVGGPLAISTAQEDALKGQFTSVTRVAGTGSDTSRFGTNAAIMGQDKPDSTTALIATGNTFPDALAVGPVAYKEGMLVGLADHGTVRKEVIDALNAQGVKNFIIVGGPLAVPESVRTQLETSGFHFVTRLDGTGYSRQGRSGTAAAVAEYATKNWGFSVNHVNVASGRPAGDGADALSAGPLSGQNNTPLLVTETEAAAGSADDYLKKHANTLQDGLLFGGVLAISDATKADMEKAAQSVTSNQTYSVTPNGATTVNTTTASNTTEGHLLRHLRQPGQPAADRLLAGLDRQQRPGLLQGRQQQRQGRRRDRAYDTARRPTRRSRDINGVFQHLQPVVPTRWTCRTAP